MMEDFSPGIIQVRDLVGRGIDPQQLQRAARGGDAIRLRRGVYYWGRDWAKVSVDERYRLQVHGVAASRRAPSVVSHLSAASVWGIPTVGAWPSSVHFSIGEASGGRGSAGIARHTGPPVTCAEVDGIVLTSVARTVIDIAASASFARGVVAMDAVLRDSIARVSRWSTSAEAIAAEFAVMRPFRGMRRVERVIEFASELSGSVGESVCRVNFDAYGFEPPVLQREFRGRNGKIFTDFWWRRSNRAAEFDGRGKYERAELLEGERPEDRLWREKLRQDDLSTQVAGVARLTWSDLASRHLFVARLAEAGIHPTQRPIAR